MSRLSIRARLALLVFALLGVTIASDLILTLRLRQDARAFMAEVAVVSTLTTANAASRAFGDAKFWFADLAVSLLTRSERNAASALERLDAKLDALEAHDPVTVAEIRRSVAALRVEAMAAVDAYTDDQRVLGNSLMAQAHTHITAVDESLGRMERALEQQAIEVRDTTLRQAQAAVVISVAVAVFAGAFAIILAFVVRRSITVPLGRLVDATRAIAHGDLSATVPAPGRDEIGDMARALEQFRSSLAERDQLAAERDAIQIARENAEYANRAKSEFLANMSHELRTPLNAIIGFSQIIKDESFGPVGSTRYRDYATDIHLSGAHLLTLINDILDLSKIESGREELHEELVDMTELVGTVATLVKIRAQDSKVVLSYEIPPDLPPIWADERKLKQILVNLMSNAVKFTPADGAARLHASYAHDAGYVFRISDTGIGIATEDIPKALEKFGQVDSELSRRFEGTGLGLPLAKALVEMHDGTLELESTVGVGTTVTVRLPPSRANLDSADEVAKSA